VNEIGRPALARCYDALGLNMSIKSAGRLNRDGVTEACGPNQVSPAKNDKNTGITARQQPSRLLSPARPNRSSALASGYLLWSHPLERKEERRRGG
jgi:hypothetical protein